MMEWWQKMVFPVRRVWVTVSTRVKARKNGLNLLEDADCIIEYDDPIIGAGLLKLRDDIQTCGYEDVQVMWEMLRRTESELMSTHAKRKHRPFWRVFVWSNQSSATSFNSNPAHLSNPI